MEKLVGIARAFSLAVALAVFAAFASTVPETRSGSQPSLGQVRIVSFNIRYYGLGGSGRGTPADERRDPVLRDFIKKHILPADVISFQEIIDVPRLRKLLPLGWNCVSYDEEDLEHQHVVLCASPEFRWMREPTDNDWTWDSLIVTDGKLRPAVHAILMDRSGRPAARVVGLHLKAFPDKADIRLKQAEALAMELRKVRDRRIPVVILGDLNTYPTPLNKLPIDDENAIEEILDRRAFEVTRAPNLLDTFRSPQSRGRFDQVYFSEEFDLMGPPSVFAVCSQAADGDRRPQNPYLNPTYYYDNVSDHCPLKVTLSRSTRRRH